MIPVNLLSPKSRSCNAVQFFSECGISPYKLVFLKRNDFKFCSEPKELGITPNKLLFSKLIAVKLLYLFQQSGIPPTNKL
ncbi:hypothetical protein ES319_D08G232500v1 [Gossypium barbadense]|uniref:Uncharacterized protein n=1 Tax=Gossypium barbadense TaxID=3634 RepID=A0A5J5QJ03_GOSBA|nr:hypothetical protein ES319_D08G232500v1 [Gossypium barbadense]